MYYHTTVCTLTAQTSECVFLLLCRECRLPWRVHPNSRPPFSSRESNMLMVVTNLPSWLRTLLFVCVHNYMCPLYAKCLTYSTNSVNSCQITLWIMAFRKTTFICLIKDTVYLIRWLIYVHSTKFQQYKVEYEKENHMLMLVLFSFSLQLTGFFCFCPRVFCIFFIFNLKLYIEWFFYNNTNIKYSKEMYAFMHIASLGITRSWDRKVEQNRVHFKDVDIEAKSSLKKVSQWKSMSLHRHREETCGHSREGDGGMNWERGALEHVDYRIN